MACMLLQMKHFETDNTVWFIGTKWKELLGQLNEWHFCFGGVLFGLQTTVWRSLDVCVESNVWVRMEILELNWPGPLKHWRPICKLIHYHISSVGTCLLSSTFFDDEFLCGQKQKCSVLQVSLRRSKFNSTDANVNWCIYLRVLYLHVSL